MDQEQYDEAYNYVKNGTSNHRFSAMIKWVKEVFDIDIIHIIYDTIGTDQRPRLTFILRTSAEMSAFHSSVGGQKESKVIPFYQKTYRDHADLKVEDIFVITLSFESAARGRLMQRLTPLLLQFERNYPEIWQIQPYGRFYIVFFYLEKQMLASEELKEKFQKEMYQNIKVFDEFNFLALDQIRITFDNRENFNTKYKGSWQLFYNL